MSEYKYRFSVVIPVYNAEKYLDETLGSVFSQTIGFKENIQLILVNDGSTDNSGTICEKYRKMYPENIKYVIKENGGVSSARNYGFSYIEGQYVNFLDADDKWATDAFEKAYDFFEKHGEEIDVVSSRLRFFEARDGWHMLDFKCNKGSRIIDLTDEKEWNCVQVQTASTFIKNEAIKNLRFNEKVKFGEDSIFINNVILEKMKYGMLDDCIYLYRKRNDKSSATQIQDFTPDYYTVSPEIYYKSLIEESLKRFGKVVPYVQNVLAYDIGRRLKSAVPDALSSDEAFYKSYIDFLREILSYVEDEVYLRSPVHKRLGIKCAFYKLKHGGKELIEISKFNLKKKSVYVDKVRLYNFNKINHSACIINFCEIEGNTLIIEGLVSRWLLSSCQESKLSLVLKSGNKIFRPVMTDYRLTKDISIFGEEQRYFLFRQRIDLNDISDNETEFKINAALTVGDKFCDITVKYGKFVSDRSVFKAAYKVMDSYIITCCAESITVKKADDIAREEAEFEEAALNWLEENSLEEFAKLRKSYYSFKKNAFKGKQLWLISDRFDKAEDNGEAFFRYVSDERNRDETILPVFVISKEYEKAGELEKAGKVIYFEDEKQYKEYFFRADRIITSSGAEFATNPLNKEERIYFGDMITSKLVFLQHGITKDDLSKWLNKNNKNIKMFVTASATEKESIINGDYSYTDETVKLTGFARYDLLENKPEKLVVIMPTWRKSIGKSYDNNTLSVYYEGFRDTEYFKFYNTLINDERLLSAMREKGYRGLFCLHPIHQKQSVDFNGNDIFAINHGFADYKKIFSAGSLLVTDYSSTFFDFVCLGKPVVYSHFDIDRFFESHSYDKGYFSYEQDGFGPVCKDIDSTVDEIISLLKRDCKIEQKYLERADKFFTFRDKNNCERIYDAIMKMQ